MAFEIHPICTVSRLALFCALIKKDMLSEAFFKFFRKYEKNFKKIEKNLKKFKNFCHTLLFLQFIYVEGQKSALKKHFTAQIYVYYFLLLLRRNYLC